MDKDDTTVPATIPAPVRKTIADRPHWITIVIGIVSPTVGIVALTISLLALNTSQQSMKVGQGAYVTVAAGTFTVENSATRPVRDNDYTHVVKLSFKIRNLGNTPASLYGISFSPESVLESRDVNVKVTAMQLTLGDIYKEEIGSKDDLSYTIDLYLRITDSKGTIRNQTERPLQIKLKGELTYGDVFDEVHRAKWCWGLNTFDSSPLHCGLE